MDKILIYKTHDGSGLANRLRAVIGYKALSKCLGMDFALCWTHDIACLAGAKSLFAENYCRLISMSELLDHAIHPACLVCEESAWFDSLWLKHGKNRFSYEHYLDAIRDELKNIKFVEAVIAEANHYASAWTLNVLPGIHIRLTDNVFEYQKWSTSAKGSFAMQKTSSLEGFYAVMDEFDKAGRFFLASDNQDVTALALERYPDRVLTYDKVFDGKASDFWRNNKAAQTLLSVPDGREDFGTDKSVCATLRGPITESGFNVRTRTTSIIDALVELLFLSRCREVVGTYYSSFGKCAALLGGIPYSEIQGTKRVFDPMLSGKMKLRCSQFLRT